MAAVSAQLLETIVELQQLQALHTSFLGGGTNLAIRYNHRQSVDIDLFFSGIIGKQSYLAIEKEIKEFYGSDVERIGYPCDVDDQFIFMRFWIKKGEDLIKVEIIQNANFLDAPDLVQGARLATVRDIGLLKLMTAANRASVKDVYDLDYLTQDISLAQLMADLEEKQNIYTGAAHRTIFDLDGEESPVQKPLRLLLFEQKALENRNRPNHSDHRILPEEGKKSWLSARSSYRSKLRTLFHQRGIEFPGIQSV